MELGNNCKTISGANKIIIEGNRKSIQIYIEENISFNQQNAFCLDVSCCFSNTYVKIKCNSVVLKNRFSVCNLTKRLNEIIFVVNKANRFIKLDENFVETKNEDEIVIVANIGFRRRQ